MKVAVGHGDHGGPRRILGIDPGSTVMGYAVVDAGESGSSSGAPSFLVAGVIDVSKYGDHYRRLGVLLSRVEQLLGSYNPVEVAIEAPFYGVNAQSMLKLGRAQGVAIAAVIRGGLPITEYAPRQVKLCVTGSGKASKEQVARVLQLMYPDAGLDALHFADATDGLAVALCHCFMTSAGPLKRDVRALFRGVRRSSGGSDVGHSGDGRGGSWADFVNRNPDRIKG